MLLVNALKKEDLKEVLKRCKQKLGDLEKSKTTATLAEKNHSYLLECLVGFIENYLDFSSIPDYTFEELFGSTYSERKSLIEAAETKAAELRHLHTKISFAQQELAELEESGRDTSGAGGGAAAE